MLQLVEKDWDLVASGGDRVTLSLCRTTRYVDGDIGESGSDNFDATHCRREEGAEPRLGLLEVVEGEGNGEVLCGVDAE